MSSRQRTNRSSSSAASDVYRRRALIVAPSRAGKTMLLQGILEGVATNYPDATLLVLPVDGRREDVTERELLGIGEVIASSFEVIRATAMIPIASST